jgi:hypothetical protein
VTFQIGIVATEGIVLASDTQQRVTERQFTDGSEYIADTIINSSKISICERHSIAIAFAGWSDEDTFAGDMLAKHLNALPSLTDDEIGPILKVWGNDYYSKSRLASGPSRGPLANLLVLRPSGRFPLIKLGVNYESSLRDSKTYMVSGHENNAAVFWLEYLRVHRETRDLDVSTAIAAVTVLTAGEINPHGIGRLEVWQFRKSWRPLPDDEIEALTARFVGLQRAIREALLMTAVP